MERSEPRTLSVWYDGDRDLLIRIAKPILDLLDPRPKARLVPFKPGSKPPRGDVVLILGSKPMKQCQDLGILHGGKTLTSLRSTPHHYEGKTYVVTYSPAIIHREPDKQADIRWDVTLASRYASTGSVKPPQGSYRYVENFDEITESVRSRRESTGQKVRIALDLETMGLDPYAIGKKIVSLSISIDEDQADVLYLYPDEVPSERVYEALEYLLNGPDTRVWGANLGFDIAWLREKWGLEVKNYTLDTTLVGSLLDENRTNSLNLHAKIYSTIGGYDDHFNALYNKAKMETIPKADLLGYAGGDTDAVLRVGEKMRSLLMRDPKLARFYTRILHPAQKAFLEVERRGVHVDMAAFHALSEEIQVEVERMTQKAIMMLSPRVREKYKDNLSLGRSVILRDYFFGEIGLGLKPKMVTSKSGLPSTASEHLSQFEKHPKAGPFARNLNALNQAKKTKATFIDGFLKHLRSDGKLHPSYLLFAGVQAGDKRKRGTVTGRLAATAPAIQTLPKHTRWAKKLRRCYPAPPGHTIWQADFSEGELRVIACLANEKTMLDSYAQGISLHAKTAAARLEMPVEEFLKLKETDPHKFAEARSGAKANNFGFIYGMGPTGFIDYVWKAWGRKITPTEAKSERQKMFETYTLLEPWYEEMKEFARRKGYVRSPLGRKRNLPMIRHREDSLRSQAERQAINSPVQSTLSDMTIWSISIIEDQIPEAGVFAMTHDSISGCCLTDDLDRVRSEVLRIMQNLPFDVVGWKPQLTFVADFECGPNWGELEEM